MNVIAYKETTPWRVRLARFILGAKDEDQQRFAKDVARTGLEFGGTFIVGFNELPCYEWWRPPEPQDEDAFKAARDLSEDFVLLHQWTGAYRIHHEAGASAKGMMVVSHTPHRDDDLQERLQEDAS